MYGKKNTKYKTLLGLLTSDLSAQTTKTGWEIVQFTIFADKKDMVCKFFRGPEDTKGTTLLAELEGEGLVRGCKATLSGRMDDGEFLASRLMGVVGSPTTHDSKVAALGGEVAAKAKWEESKKYHEGKGFAFCWDADRKCGFWHPKGDTQSYSGKVYRKIDFICEVLGGETVTRRMREAGIAFSISGFDQKRYMALKSALMSEALTLVNSPSMEELLGI